MKENSPEGKRWTCMREHREQRKGVEGVIVQKGLDGSVGTTGPVGFAIRVSWTQSP